MFGVPVNLGSTTLTVDGAYLTTEQADALQRALATAGGDDLVTIDFSIPPDCELTATYARWLAHS